MESSSNQKSVENKKIYFDFFEIILTLCPDEFAHYWHSLNQLHEVTWNAFQFTGVPCYFVEFLSLLMRLSQSVVL